MTTYRLLAIFTWGQGYARYFVCQSPKPNKLLLADRTEGRAYATVFRPSSSVVYTECITAKRCSLEQKLLLTAYRKSYMRNRLVPKWMTLTFV